MSLFPFFINIQNEKGLIIGGGKHALEKIQKLKPFKPNLYVISPYFSNEIEKDSDLILIKREFENNDLDDSIKFVIVATDDIEKNHKISELCKEKRILVNVVDDQNYCDFIFPSLISKGNLTIGVCTNGSSPATGVLLKQKIEEQIPENIEDILDFLQEIRPLISKQITNKKQRFQLYYAISKQCMDINRPLTQKELETIIKDSFNCND